MESYKQGKKIYRNTNEENKEEERDRPKGVDIGHRIYCTNTAGAGNYSLH
jgi:hypothetical protein